MLALTGVIPAIAISAGLLSLPTESATRQQYWPWLAVIVLAVGFGSSCFFWLLAARRDSGKDGDKPR